MPVEPGQRVLVYVGDGGELEETGAVYSVVGASNEVARSAGDYVAGGVKVGMLAHIAGYTENPETFHGIVSAVDADTVTLANVVDGDGNPTTLVDEAAGAAITLTFENFIKIGGQDDGQLATAATSFDTSTKDTGLWGTSEVDSLKQTITVNGKANWPDTKGLSALLQQINLGERLDRWFKFVFRQSGSAWVGLYVIQQIAVGGAKGGPTTYNMSLENKLRPRLIEAA
jgi:hypothetical protein